MTGAVIAVFVALAAFSFLLSSFLTPLCRDAFHALGILDYPDRHRKFHSAPVPRAGGTSIAIAYTVSLTALFLLPASHLPALNNVPGWWTAVGAAVVFTIGLIDDLAGLSAWIKLTGQAAAALVAYSGGVSIAAIAGHQIGLWSLPMTVLWLIGCTNAFNLIDGIDGLSAGLGLFATMTMLIAAFYQNNAALALAGIPLAGCLLGFLRYNFSRASVFLGDSGSMLIGFLLGCFGAVWSQKSATLLGMTAPLMALAVPLLDTVLSTFRRILRLRSIFRADHGHIHHRLLDLGFSPREAVLILYSACGVGGVFSLLQSWMPHRIGGPIVVVFCLGTGALSLIIHRMRMMNRRKDLIEVKPLALLGAGRPEQKRSGYEQVLSVITIVLVAGCHPGIGASGSS